MKVSKSLTGSTNDGTATAWPVLAFALIALGGGLAAMAALPAAVTAGAITALVTAVLGVVGTHAGHVAGQKLAAKQAAAHPLVAGLDQLAQLNKQGSLDDDEFAKAKGKLLD